jgi:uncharacterized membrane protein
MEYFEQNLAILAATLKLILESISLLCILLGLLKTGQLVFVTPRRSRIHSLPLMNLRIAFGRWLSLALEFQLAADIVNTTIAPSLDALGKLGAIAVIRTFLNYFLNRELIEELEMAQERKSVTTLPEDKSHATTP